MVFVLVRHNVKDYNAWREVYDDHGDTRAKSGCLSEDVFVGAEDGKKIFLLFEWDSIENAKKFTGSEDLKQTMKKAGVMGKPEVDLIEPTEEA